MPAKSEVKIFRKVPPEAIAKHWRTMVEGQIAAKEIWVEEEKRWQETILEVVNLLQEKQVAGEFSVGETKIRVDHQREENDPQGIIDIWLIGPVIGDAEKVAYLYKITTQESDGSVRRVAAQKRVLGDDGRGKWLAMTRGEIQELKEVLAAGLSEGNTS